MPPPDPLLDPLLVPPLPLLLLRPPLLRPLLLPLLLVPPLPLPLPLLLLVLSPVPPSSPGFWLDAQAAARGSAMTAKRRQVSVEERRIAKASRMIESGGRISGRGVRRAGHGERARKGAVRDRTRSTTAVCTGRSVSVRSAHQNATRRSFRGGKISVAPARHEPSTRRRFPEIPARDRGSRRPRSSRSRAALRRRRTEVPANRV